LSADEIKSKVRSFVKEYFSSGDFGEVKECIKEVGGKEVLSEVLVSDGIMTAVEGKDNDRRALANLLPLLFGEEFLSAAQIEAGFSSVLAQSEDLGVDYPRMIEHIAGILGELILKNVLPLGVLAALGAVITDSGDKSKFPTFVLVSLKKSKGEDEIVNMVKAANLTWKDIGDASLTAEQTKKILNDKKLEMLIGVL
jgi:hypothetical protein